MKNIKDIEFNDIAFIEQKGRKAVILYGKDKIRAENLHKAMTEKGFNFKSKPESNGCYTIGLDVESYGTTLILETKLKKETYPQLVWLENSSISDVIIAYKDGKNTELIYPTFPLNSLFYPN
ncbi:hypothetical protein [Algibacter pectinivorans]|uniref:Uncharacterized protein n=1 Tax=Algibacter pectinivorans TaxID=870482 RepID=A0A1I1SAE4_9FLAO|nr:hypothetical protein [Algibacter pectinivorans]SFD43302.1 hypothetical protein SAMN04487987_1173 [Algibacter pectinivorans]